MNEKRAKHLVVAIAGAGLCIAGPTISNWSIVVGKDIINTPFIVIGVCLTIIGVLSCLGAMVCQSGRYEKSKKDS